MCLIIRQPYIRKTLIKSNSAAGARSALSFKHDQELSQSNAEWLLMPATLGWLLHVPIYYPLKKLVENKTKETVFFDSVLFGILLIVYPIYLLLIFSGTFFLVWVAYGPG